MESNYPVRRGVGRPRRAVDAAAPQAGEPEEEAETVAPPPVTEPEVQIAPQEDQPHPTWETIDTAPLDGRDVFARWGEDDASGRSVHWKQGRAFNGRRWTQGGRWATSEDLHPLPADPPTHWLKPPPSSDDEVLDDDVSAAA